MKKRAGRSGSGRGRVSEPVQVYLAGPDLELLDRLATRLGATKSDVLRRGLTALDAQSVAARRAEVGPRIPVFSGGTGPRAGVTFDRMAALLDIMDAADDPR
jgi:hypothetical protein